MPDHSRGRFWEAEASRTKGIEAPMGQFLRIYHRLPAPFWTMIASVKGYALKRRRYGEIYRRALPCIRRRQSWERRRWEEFQRRQLSELLGRAVEGVNAYRGMKGIAQKANGDPISLLKSWPLLNVDHFRENPDEYRDRDYGFRGCIELFTSGTTGTPKKIVRDLRAEQLNYAYCEDRWRNNAGVTLDDRWIMIGGQLVVPVRRKRAPFCVASYPTRQLYASSYHLKAEFAEEYMRAIKRWRPIYMVGYPSSLNMLAEFSLLTGIRLQLKSIISNAEPLYEHVRERLRETFECQVYDTYGSTEGAFFGFECSERRMHISPDFGVFEILRDDGNDCEPGELGRVVVTGLTNRAMPLIRYPVGDSASWAKPEECRCGCSFPVIERIEGRTDDLLELPDGRLIGRLDPVFKGGLPIREAQIAQKDDARIEVRVVADVPPGSEDRTRGLRHWRDKYEDTMLRELRDRLGSDVSIRILYVDRIPRSANNKFKAVVREVSSSVFECS